MSRRVDMGPRALMVLLTLWSSGLRAERTHLSTVVPGEVRLVGEGHPCAGILAMKDETGWQAVDDKDYNCSLTCAAAVCTQVDCGSVVSLRRTPPSSVRPSSSSVPGFLEMGSMDILSVGPDPSPINLVNITCSASVRLVNGSNLCSGRLEVKPEQSWSSVCGDGFDLQDAEVVCRELGCGAPSVFKGGLFGESEAPAWTKEFQCRGHESALLDCDSSRSTSDTCSPGGAVGLACSDPGDVRLVGGASQCAGALELKQWGEWRPVDENNFDLKFAATVCGHLDCGSPVSTRGRPTSQRQAWGVRVDCDAPLLGCVTRPVESSDVVELTCSASVRLVNGSNLCSGRLEVKPEQSWSSVCGDGFDLQDAEVVCRELGCGAPSVFKGGLFGESEAPAWTKEFQCRGHESALLDCDSSRSASDTCSPGGAVGLACSDQGDVQLVGGATRCSGRLEVNHGGGWNAVGDLHFDWNLQATAAMCRRLDCGAAVSAFIRQDSPERPGRRIDSSCVQSKSALKECLTAEQVWSSSSLDITCSDSVRLVSGSNLCSGRLEVKAEQSWSSVCGDGFDLQDAEVVCRELGCGAPSVFKGGLYGESEAPAWTKEFQCRGHESALLDCDRTDTGGNTCSSGKVVALTCSGNARLEGEPSSCAGALEVKNRGEWRPLALWDFKWDQDAAAAACAQLGCGTAVSASMTDSPDRPVWWIRSSCVRSTSALWECVILDLNNTESYDSLQVTCSDLLAEPIISFVPSADGVSEAEQQDVRVLRGSSFSILCSVAPQYPGGSFQLIFTTSGGAQSDTLPAVNHSALFLVSAARAQHGTYTCVYHVHVLHLNFSSASQPLRLSVAAPLTELIIRLVVVVLLTMMLLVPALYFNCKASRSQ